jgi:hypothetical protein
MARDWLLSWGKLGRNTKKDFWQEILIKMFKKFHARSGF